MQSSTKHRIIGLLSVNGDRCQSFFTIRYWCTEFPNVSEGATKLNFRVEYRMAGCCPTPKKGSDHLRNWFH